MRKFARGALVAAGGAALMAGLAGCAEMNGMAGSSIEVAEVGSFHVPGRTVVLQGLPERDIVFTAGAPPLKVNPNGSFAVEQMYVQYVKLANPRARYPLLMWHGGGLSGVTWETKPDGRPGWQSFFLKAGNDVYVSDAVERGRAGWARYPEIFKTEPLWRTPKEAWELFRIGPVNSFNLATGAKTAFPNTQFPLASFDQFMQQGVPRWATNDAATQKAYDALVQKICPCVVMMHSQGGNFGFNAALNAPDKVKAVIAIEPSGAPDPTKSSALAVKGIPHLFVYGDFLEQNPFWVQLTGSTRRWHEAINAAGGNSEWLDLPKAGTPGNGHMLMMDQNSDQIAGMVQAWMTRQGLMK